MRRGDGDHLGRQRLQGLILPSLVASRGWSLRHLRGRDCIGDGRAGRRAVGIGDADVDKVGVPVGFPGRDRVADERVQEDHGALHWLMCGEAPAARLWGEEGGRGEGTMQRMLKVRKTD